jgi:hypothetical protein
MKEGVDSVEVSLDGVVTDAELIDPSGELGFEQRPDVPLFMTGVGSDENNCPLPPLPECLDLAAVTPVESPSFDAQRQQLRPQRLMDGSEEVISR